MAQPVVRTTTISLSRVVMFFGFVLFLIAALDLGLSWSIPPWCFGFSGFALMCLAWAL